MNPKTLPPVCLGLHVTSKFLSWSRHWSCLLRALGHLGAIVRWDKEPAGSRWEAENWSATASRRCVTSFHTWNQVAEDSSQWQGLSANCFSADSTNGLSAREQNQNPILCQDTRKNIHNLLKLARLCISQNNHHILLCPPGFSDLLWVKTLYTCPKSRRSRLSGCQPQFEGQYSIYLVMTRTIAYDSRLPKMAGGSSDVPRPSAGPDH